MVIDVMLAIVSTLNRLASGSFPPLNDHLALGCGLPLNGTSIAVDVPALRIIFSLYSPIVGGTASKTLRYVMCSYAAQYLSQTLPHPAIIFIFISPIGSMNL